MRYPILILGEHSFRWQAVDNFLLLDVNPDVSLDTLFLSF